VSANPNDAVRYAQAIVPDLKQIIAPPQNFRIEQRFRSDSKIHGDKSFSDSHLGRSDSPTIAVGSAELAECRVQLTNFPSKILVFRRNLFCRSLKSRITDDQNRKWEKSQSSEPSQNPATALSPHPVLHLQPAFDQRRRCAFRRIPFRFSRRSSRSFLYRSCLWTGPLRSGRRGKVDVPQ